MSPESAPPSDDFLSNAENTAERRRMSFGDLLFLAAGGAIGSGWLIAGSQAQKFAGTWALGSWVIGGAILFVVAAVMVKLSVKAPTTGGLVFLPLQGSGPLLAIGVAASVLIFYAADPASEAIVVVQNLHNYWNWTLPGVHASANNPPWPEIGWAALFLVPMVAVNMLGPRRFLQVNAVLTVFKILVPLMIIALLIHAEVSPGGPRMIAHPPRPTEPSPRGMLSVVVGMGATTIGSVAVFAVFYSYTGFQGPLDFAGNVKRRGIGWAARLRWSVYGTILGTFLLYFSLQFVAMYISGHSFGHYPNAKTCPLTPQGPTYADFTCAVAPGWARVPAVWLLRLDTVLSPIGSGMVFTYVLTREVAALSGAHLTHRGLRASKYSVISLKGPLLRRLLGDSRLDIFWLILIVDFVITWFLLLYARGNWAFFTALTSLVALIAYAMPSVVLASLRQRDPGAPSGLRGSVFPVTAFVLISVILFLAGWDPLWRAMVALAVCCFLLFLLPLYLPRVAWASRWYDAKAHATRFRQWRTDPAAQSALVLFGFLTLLTVATLVNKVWRTPNERLACAIPVAVVACFVFRALVTLSRRYMREHPPTLPTPPPGGPGAATGPR